MSQVLLLLNKTYESYGHFDYKLVLYLKTEKLIQKSDEFYKCFDT